MIFVDDLYVSVGFDISTGDNAGLITFYCDHASAFAVVLHHQALHVQNDFRNIFANARKGREFVLSASNFDLRNGASFQA